MGVGMRVGLRVSVVTCIRVRFPVGVREWMRRTISVEVRVRVRVRVNVKG